MDLKSRIKRHLVVFTATVLALLLIGCYSGSSGKRTRTSTGKHNPRSDVLSKDSQFPQPQATALYAPRRYPWETWPLHRDLLGKPLVNPTLLRGDELVDRGARKEALEQFRIAQAERLSPTEVEALALRLASTMLALDQAKAALDFLGEYFKGRAIDQVEMRFSIVFAYAYGRSGDIDQSLAWFGRLHRMVAGQGGLDQAAESGVRMLLRSIPDNRFYPLARVWSTDMFIHKLMGQESSRRAREGQAPNDPENVFLALNQQLPVKAVQSGEIRRIIVMLPLTGNFAALGKNTKTGIELALDGQPELQGMQVDYQDTAGDPAQAASLVRAIGADAGQTIVLGPLLAEAALAASEAARELGIPLMALSKKSYFPVGDSVFRFGPTLDSQINSLLEESASRRGLQRYALVHAEDPVSREAGDTFKRIVRERGQQLVYEISYFPEDLNAFVTIASDLESNQVQAVFIPDSLEIAGRLATSLPEHQRRKTILLGTAKWDDSLQLKRSGTSLAGAIFVSPFNTSSTRDFVSQFKNTYQARNGSAPDFLAAQGFDAATLVVAALKRHRSEGIDFVSALHGIDSYAGLTGQIRVDQSGEVDRKFAVVELTADGVKELSGLGTAQIVLRGEHEL